MLKPKYILAGTALLALFGSNLLCGCGTRPEDAKADPGTPEERQRKDAAAQAAESGGGEKKVAGPNDHGDISGETGGDPSKK